MSVGTQDKPVSFIVTVAVCWTGAPSLQCRWKATYSVLKMITIMYRREAHD